MTADGEIPARDRDTRRRTAPSSPAKARGQPRLGRMHERLQDVNILLSVTRHITSQLDLDQLLQRVMTEAARMLVKRSTLFLHDEKTSELFSRVAMGSETARFRSPRCRHRRHRVHHRQDCQHSSRLCRSALQHQPQADWVLHTLHIVHAAHQQARLDHRSDPLLQKRRPIFRQMNPCLKAFTAQVAIALENAEAL